MLSYCLKCRKNTESKNPKVTRTKKGRIVLLLKFLYFVLFCIIKSIQDME